MRYRIDVWKQEEKDGTYLWGWSIFDENGDEVASQDTMFTDNKKCREEARASLSDYQ